MQFRHQWTETREARCAMACQITYTFLAEVLFTITITWFPQVTRLEEPHDFCWVWTPYYTVEVEWGIHWKET